MNQEGMLCRPPDSFLWVRWIEPTAQGGCGGTSVPPRSKGGQRAQTNSLSDTVHFVASDQGGLVPPEARAAREGEGERWAGVHLPSPAPEKRIRRGCCDALLIHL